MVMYDVNAAQTIASKSKEIESATVARLQAVEQWCEKNEEKIATVSDNQVSFLVFSEHVSLLLTRFSRKRKTMANGNVIPYQKRK